MEFYLANGGAQILKLVAGREEVAQGGGHDIDAVIAELDGIVQGKAA